MALVSGSLVDEARDLHPSFDRRNNPDKLILRELERYERELIEKVVAVNEDYLRTTIEETLPPPTPNFPAWATGLSLPDHLVLHDAEYQIGTDWYRMHIRPMAVEHDPGPMRTAYVAGRTAWLRGVEADWNGVSAVRFHYTAAPSGLPDLNTALTIGDSARTVLVNRLAFTMAKRAVTVPNASPPNVAEFRIDWQQAEEAYIVGAGGIRAGHTSQVREVW